MTARAATGARVLIVGAGFSGLACARALAAEGLRPVLVDKGRGPGGRASTRRVVVAGASVGFDHGAQYFTARDARFVEELQRWREVGLVAPWSGRIVELRAARFEAKADGPERFVGVPAMNAPLRALAEGLELHLGRRVDALLERSGAWEVELAGGERWSGFDAVVLALPAAQVAELCVSAPELAKQAGEVEMPPCWAAMLAFESALALPYDGAFVEDSPLAWIARDSSKPGRPPGERWVLHAGVGWSSARLEDEPQAVARQLTTALVEATGRKLPALLHLDAHRWRFARVEGAAAADCLYLPERRLGACGDWCVGGRVEGAWLSGLAMAQALLEGGLA